MQAAEKMEDGSQNLRIEGLRKRVHFQVNIHSKRSNRFHRCPGRPSLHLPEATPGLPESALRSFFIVANRMEIICKVEQENF
jgi:hypothetical protein